MTSVENRQKEIYDTETYDYLVNKMTPIPYDPDAMISMDEIISDLKQQKPANMRLIITYEPKRWDPSTGSPQKCFVTMLPLWPKKGPSTRSWIPLDSAIPHLWTAEAMSTEMVKHAGTLFSSQLSSHNDLHETVKQFTIDVTRRTTSTTSGTRSKVGQLNKPILVDLGPVQDTRSARPKLVLKLLWADLSELPVQDVKEDRWKEDDLLKEWRNTGKGVQGPLPSNLLGEENPDGTLNFG